jgi:hypothetical protein
VLDRVKNSQDSRYDKVDSVLSHVRLPVVSPYFLFDKLDAEPLLTADPQCRELMDEAKKHFVLKVTSSSLSVL